MCPSIAFVVVVIGHHCNCFRCCCHNRKSGLIVVSVNSKIFLHICNDCRIFREGVKGATAIPNGLFGRNLAFGLISTFGQNLAFSRTMAFGLITTIFGNITVGCCIALQFCHITVGSCIALQLHHCPNCLAVADGLIDLIGFRDSSLGIIGLRDCIIGRNGLINFVGSMVCLGPIALSAY